MVCAGNSVTYQTTSTSGHHYRWVVTGGTVVSGAGTYSLVVNWPTPGNWSVALFDSTSTCKDSTIKKIKVGLNSAVLTAAPLNAVGSASVSGRTATITTASGNENGATWNPYSIDLNKNFDFTFTTNQNGAADGMMFIIQNTSSTTYNSAGQGSDMGYYNASSGNMDGRKRFFQVSFLLSPINKNVSRISLEIMVVPASTLNRIYHCTPNSMRIEDPKPRPISRYAKTVSTMG